MIYIFCNNISWGFDTIKDILEVVMIPIALALLALLAEWIARRSENRRRDSETKAELVAEISELVMTTVMPLQLCRSDELQINIDDCQEKELKRIYKEWSINTCVIGSKLHAYFPKPKNGGERIHEKWRDFSKQLSDYYKENMREGDKWDEGEKERLFEEKAKIIAKILTSKITGFRDKYQRESFKKVKLNPRSA